VEIVASPAPVNLDIENHIRYESGRCSGSAARVDFKVASAAWDRVVFSGALSAHCAPRTIARILLQPATYAYGTFVKLWRESGGEFSGKLRIEPTPADAKSLYSFDSLNLARSCGSPTNTSNNLMGAAFVPDARQGALRRSGHLGKRCCGDGGMESRTRL